MKMEKTLPEIFIQDHKTPAASETTVENKGLGTI
jgi:hypothetical protein